MKIISKHFLPSGFKYLFFFLLLSCWNISVQKCHAQFIEEGDTIDVELPVHNTMKATMYSAVLPGLGQLYNGHWYKVPIIYGGLAALAYSAIYYGDLYVEYRNAYADYINYGEENCAACRELDNYVAGSTSNRERIEFYKDSYLRRRDLSVIGFAGLYALNIIEANVSAHFFSYDISDDLAIKINPQASLLSYNNPLQQPFYGLIIRIYRK